MLWHEEFCINTLSSHLAADCEWTTWEAWTACSQTCDGGIRQRFRGKTDATGAGKPCEGPAQEDEMCGTVPCHGRS